MLTASLVRTPGELDQIALLSQANLVTQLSAQTKAEEGFVTWQYTPNILRALHGVVPSVIVKDGDILAGYALSLTRECIDIYPVMMETVTHVSALPYKDQTLADYRIYFMGQICVAAPYRGLGVVAQLYRAHQAHFSTQFDMLITEISVHNPRSLKAHRKVGFKVVDTYSNEGDDWDVVVLDWASQENGAAKL